MKKPSVQDLRKKLIQKAKKQVQEKYTARDVHIAKSVGLLEDLDNIFNLLAEQTREWYSVHFPELQREVNDNEAYLKLVFHLGLRDAFQEKAVMEHFSNPEKARKIAAHAGKSVGAPLEKADLEEIRLVALNALNLREERTYLLQYLENTLRAYCPTVFGVAGAPIGAKLIAKAGSLEKLALMPSSTVQILGAEKALFQAKKKRSKRTPKYGYLYNHPMVRATRSPKKGKMARILAGKISIAAKRDFFKGSDLSEGLKKELQAASAKLQ